MKPASILPPQREQTNSSSMTEPLSSPDHSVAAEPLAAVYHDDRAVDEAHGVGAEEDRALLYVAYAPEAAERDVALEPLFHVGRDEALHAFRVFDGAGRDCVDAYAVRAPLDGEVARQGVDARLRRRDVKLVGRAEVVQRRADVEYLSATLLQLL